MNLKRSEREGNNSTKRIRIVPCISMVLVNVDHDVKFEGPVFL